MLDIYHLKKFDFMEWNRLGKLSYGPEAIDLYLDDLAAVFDLNSLRGFTVLIDCTNGTSSVILKRMVERFQMRFILINDQLEGRAFAHTPATTQKVVAMQLAPLIRHVGADAGFLFDIDSDRVALATEKGEPVNEELVMALLADEFLTRGPGKIVIANVSTTALLEDVAARHGGRVERVAVGRQATIDALAGFPADSIALAGEGTGAVMLPQFRFVYDGIASMLGVLELIRRRGQTLSSVLASFPRYSILKGEVPLETHRIPQMLHDLEKRYADGRRSAIDGLRIDFPDRWFHVRVSQTEPIVRVICEQKGEAPKELFQELMQFVRSYNS